MNFIFKILLMNLGRKIKLARVAKGWSQEDLAEKINKTRPLISHIENTGKANAYTLTKICKVLSLDLAAVTDETEINPGDFYISEKNLSKEIIQLNDKIKLLEDLVESQRDLISNLKKQVEKKRK